MFSDIRKLVTFNVSSSGLLPLVGILEGLAGQVKDCAVLVMIESENVSMAKVRKIAAKISDSLIIEQNNMKLSSGNIYFLYLDREVSIDNSFEFSTTGFGTDIKTVITKGDELLTSLVEILGDRLVSIVLSGIENLRVEGYFSVHSSGGMVLVQDPNSCQYDSLPKNIISRGIADVVLDCEDIIEFLLNIFEGREITEQYIHELDVMQVNRVIDILCKSYNVDFNYYKLSTVRRRIYRRMKLCDIETVDAYVEYLELNNPELHNLYQDLLIGVTEFFRDREAFALLKKDIVPELISSMAGRKEFRVWDAACATGQEAYSIAIICHETIRELGVDVNVKILATDIHADSINFASRGVYSKQAISKIPKYLRDRYFVQLQEDQYQVVPEIRQKVLFSQHDILSSPPFTRMDLVCCRNFLIYLKAASQIRAVSQLHFSLNFGGVLFLGPSEMLGDVESSFDVINRQWRLFKKVSNGRHVFRGDNSGVNKPVNSVASQYSLAGTYGNSHSRVSEIQTCYEQLLKSFVKSGVVVNSQNFIVLYFGDSQKYFNLSGRVDRDILQITSGELRMVISSGFRKLDKDKKDLVYEKVHCKLYDGTEQCVNVHLKSLDNSSTAGYRFVGLETVESEPQEKTKVLSFDSDNELYSRIEVLEDELARTRESLRNAVQELEANNEEFQSANEELTASNEELHATNEELHSVNEELFVVNSQYERKIGEVNQANNDIKNLLDNMDIGVIFLDRELKIRYYSPIAEELFHLAEQDIGRPIRHFRSNLEDTASLEDDCKSVIARNCSRELQVKSLEGKVYQKRLLPYINLSGDCSGVIITLIDITERYQMEQWLSESELKYRTLFDSIEEGMSLNRIIVNESGEPVDYVTEVINPAFEKITGWTSDIVGKAVSEYFPDMDDKYIKILGKVALTGESTTFDYYDKRQDKLRHVYAYCPEPGKFVSLSTDITEHERTKRELKNSEFRFRSFFEQVNVIALRCTSSLIVADYNKEAEKQFGYLRDDIIGNYIVDIIFTDEKDKKFLADVFERVLAGYPVYGMKNEVLKNDKTKITIQWNAVRELNGQGDVVGLLITARNITQEARVMDMLSEREELFRSIFEDSPIGIEIYDETGKLMHVNRSCAKIFGILGNEQQMYGFNLFDDPHLDTDMVNAIKSGKDLRYEFEYDFDRLKSYGVLTCDRSGSAWLECHVSPLMEKSNIIMGYLVQVVDFSGQRQALSELEENRNRLELAQRTANLGYWRWDIDNDEYIFSCDAGLILNNSAREIIYNSRQLENMLSDSFSSFISANNEVVATGASQEFVVMAKTNVKVKYLKVNVSRMVDSNLKVTGTQGTILDVTELVEARHNAEFANNAKSIFLANMSHEIRTPLNVIVGYSEQLAKESLKTQQRDYVGNIVKSGYELLNTVEDILDISRVEAGKITINKDKCSLKDIVQEVYDHGVLAAEDKKVVFELNMGQDIDIYTDRLRLKQCLLNLVNNAVKFTDDGKIVIRTSIEQDDDRECVYIEVDDTGIGVPEDKQDVIFNVFSQADSGHSKKYSGVGLGLSITQALAGKLGGSVELVNKLGTGSLFRLIVPVDCDGIAQHDKASTHDLSTKSSSEELETSSPKAVTGEIIIAEDNLPNQKLINIMLNRMFPGLELVFVSNGQHLLDEMESKQFDIVLLDMSMPVMDGFKAVAQIRAQGDDIPVVALTANAMAGDREKCIEAGCSDYISKPISQTVLHDVILKYL